jgi:hypothetical protein
MKEVKCRVCGGATIQEDGICRPCALFKKDEVAALSEIRKGGIKKAAEKMTTLRQTNPQKIKKEEIMPVSEENKGRKCSVDDCMKYAVKDGMCTRHFKESHGIKKRLGRKPAIRGHKVCSKCNTEALSNRAKECHKCGEQFLKKGTAGREEKKQRGRPTNYGKSQGRIATPSAERSSATNTLIRNPTQGR